MTQLFLTIAFPLAAAFAEFSVDELPAPAVSLTESEGDVADSSARRLIGPPNTWSVREWSQYHMHNHPECPYEEPMGGWCSERQANLECYYDEICCPDHKRCTARKTAKCVHLLGPSHNTYSWSTQYYGQRYYNHGKCYLGHASSDGRRRTSDDELRRDMPEMDVQTASNEIQQDSSSSRRMVGPSWTWPVDRWSPNPRNCPRDQPGHGEWGNDNHRGLTCRYEKVCCPDHKRCVAHKQATCQLMLPSGCKWQVSYYGQRDYEHGLCRIVRSRDTGDVPSNSPSYPRVFG